MRKILLIFGFISALISALIVFIYINSKTVDYKAMSVNKPLPKGSLITSDELKSIKVPRGTHSFISNESDLIGKYASRDLIPNIYLIKDDTTFHELPTSGYTVSVNVPPMNVHSGMEVVIINTPSKSGIDNKVDPTHIHCIVQSITTSKGMSSQEVLTLIMRSEDDATKVLGWNANSALGVEVKYGD